jgi:hypothetical protein
VPTIDRPEPPCLQISGHIREEVLAGRLAGGDPLRADGGELAARAPLLLEAARVFCEHTLEDDE